MANKPKLDNYTKGGLLGFAAFAGGWIGWKIANWKHKKSFKKLDEENKLVNELSKRKKLNE
mgnify:CR=1 FL=1